MTPLHWAIVGKVTATLVLAALMWLLSVGLVAVFGSMPGGVPTGVPIVVVLLAITGWVAWLLVALKCAQCIAAIWRSSSHDA